jgi:hypothetical protein
VMCFGISGFEPLGYATRKLISNKVVRGYLCTVQKSKTFYNYIIPLRSQYRKVLRNYIGISMKTQAPSREGVESMFSDLELS